MEKSKVEYTSENGFGDPGITKFIRRFHFIPPHTIKIYDELEAKEPRRWTWLLHSYQPLMAEESDHKQIIYGSNEKANAKVEISASQAIETHITDQFFSPAINWKGTEHDGEVIVYNNHYHAEVQTLRKSRKVTFTATIEIEGN
jgi:hypothetical protein